VLSVKKILLFFTGIFFNVVSCELVQDISWIHGSWIETTNPEPDTHVVRYEPDGDYEEYTDYFEKTIAVCGTWTCKDDILKITIETSTYAYTIKKIDTHTFTRSQSGSPSRIYYRKSAYPLNFTPPAITVNGGWIINTLLMNEVIWYYFNATAGVSYTIYWDDIWEGNNNCSGRQCTADVVVSAYREDLFSPYFENRDNGYLYPAIITAAETERMYIKVDAAEKEGSVALQVTQ
jgi:hypothetical protein